MNAIPQWKDTFNRGNDTLQITFEDGSTLTWDLKHPSKRLILVPGTDSATVTRLQAFVQSHGSSFRGTQDMLLADLTTTFPPRSFPDPVIGCDLIGAEQPIEDVIRYRFTGDADVQYSPTLGRLVFVDRTPDQQHPLRRAVEAAFPLSLTVLSPDELRVALQQLCLSPSLAVTTTRAQSGKVKPVRRDADYRWWYPFETVRCAENNKEPCQEEVLEEWQAMLQRSMLDPQNLPHHLLVHAPTGLGKTSAAIAPALAWQQDASKQRQIYYLVSTVNQHDNPVQELKRIYRMRTGRHLLTHLRVVDLVGQAQRIDEGRTFCPHPHMRPVDPICKDSRTAASWDRFGDMPLSWREVAAALEGTGFCPYHYLQGLMATADIVICDYWWVFDEDARHVWHRTSGFGSRDVALIVDEAHNLPSRIRNSRDVTIHRDELARRLEQTTNVAAAQALMPLLDLLFDQGELAEESRTEGLAPDQLAQYLDRAALNQAVAFWEQQRELAEGEAEREMLPEERVVRALQLSGAEAAEYVIYTVVEEATPLKPIPPEPSLNIRRIHVTEALKQGYSRVKASITLSGTLVAPGDTSQALEKLVPQFGLPTESTKVIKAGSPFPVGNQLWVYSSYASGIYRQRHNYLPYYAHSITEIGKATPGGVTAVFFNSYEFLRAVFEQMPRDEQARVVQESRIDMLGGVAEANSVEGYEALLRVRMDQEDGTDSRAYLFAVYGGKLAQGANFRNNLIQTVVCVSLPAEMVELFHVRLVQFLWPILHPDQQMPDLPLNAPAYEKRRMWTDVWEYAYERPAMYQVLQACGRGIRAQNDRCAFVLLDRRYHEFRWHNALSPEPFHTETPQVHVRNFHAGGPERFLETTNRWEPLLPMITAL